MRRFDALVVLISLSSFGCLEPTCAPADLTPPSERAAYAVVLSDYASTAIALLDEDGALVSEAYVDSGTVRPILVAALSGDVVLPNTPIDGCVLGVIDRLGTDVVTQFDLCGAEPSITQLEVGASFRANPQDALSIGDEVWVSRSEPNLEPGAPPLEAGNDVVVVDRASRAIVRRIDLSGFDVTSPEHQYARPARMVRLGDSPPRVVVGLSRSSLDYHLSGPGAVAVIDPTTDETLLVEISGLTSCVEVDRVPGVTNGAVVTCFGDSFGNEEDRRAGAGVAWLEMAPDGTVVVAEIQSSVGSNTPVFNTFAVPLSADTVVVTAMGEIGQGDRVLMLRRGEAPSALFESTEPFSIGDGSYDAARGLLLIPDAAAGVVRRFERDSAGAFVELDGTPVTGCRGLPPREVRALRP